MKNLYQILLIIQLIFFSNQSHSADIDKCLDFVLVHEKIGTLIESGDNLFKLKLELIKNLRSSTPSSIGSANISEAFALTDLLSFGVYSLATSSFLLIRTPVTHPDYFNLQRMLLLNYQQFINNNYTANNRIRATMEEVDNYEIKNTLGKIFSISMLFEKQFGACKNFN